jgi:hypothetical protein
MMYNSTVSDPAGVSTAAAGASLAFTGAHVLALVIIGTGLLVAGLSILCFGRYGIRRLGRSFR